MFGVLCIGLLQHIYTGRQPSNEYFNELIVCLDSTSSDVRRSIEKTIEQQVDNEIEFNVVEKTGSTLSKKLYTQSIHVIKYIDSVKNIIASSNKRDNYIDNNITDNITEYDNGLLDSGIRMLPEQIRERVYCQIGQILWNKELNNSLLIKKLFKHQKKHEAIALLSALKANVLFATKRFVDEIARSYAYYTCGFNTIQAIAVPNTSYAISGDNARATLFQAAYYNKIDPTIATNVKSNIKVERGVASLTTYATTPGIKILSGTASIQLRDTIRTYPWQTQYYVAPKGIYMHVDNANKCYAGIPFSMTIGVDEYSADKLSLRSKNAVIKKITDSTYSITAPKGVQSFMVYMDAVNKDGSISQSIAAKHIKVLQPLPDISIGNIQHGLIAKGYIQQHPTLSAIPRDEELDITYYIKQYTISSISKDNRYIEPITINSSKIDTDIIQSLHSGDRLLITDIIATDNYGNIHRLPGTTFRVE